MPEACLRARSCARICHIMHTCQRRGQSIRQGYAFLPAVQRRGAAWTRGQGRGRTNSGMPGVWRKGSSDSWILRTGDAICTWPTRQPARARTRQPTLTALMTLGTPEPTDTSGPTEQSSAQGQEQHCDTWAAHAEAAACAARPAAPRVIGAASMLPPPTILAQVAGLSARIDRHETMLESILARLTPPTPTGGSLLPPAVFAARR